MDEIEKDQVKKGWQDLLAAAKKFTEKCPHGKLIRKCRENACVVAHVMTS